MSSPDPFSARFDSIEIDPASAPSQAALDHAFSFIVPQEGAFVPDAAQPAFAAPGFYLLDDAGGRFEIDRDFGVITLRDESILDAQRDTLHAVRLRVIEPSGASYELDMQLRLTGRVPLMVGADEHAFLAGLATGATTMPASTPRAEAPVVIAPWTKYAAAYGLPGKAELVPTRRTFIAAELPVNLSGPAALSLDEALPPVGLQGAWPY